MINHKSIHSINVYHNDSLYNEAIVESNIDVCTLTLRGDGQLTFSFWWSALDFSPRTLGELGSYHHLLIGKLNEKFLFMLSNNK